jgi:antitoxin ChpS
MHTTNLRKVGGSVMLAIPPALVDLLRLQPSARVGAAVESGRFIVEAQLHRYTVDEWLARCDSQAPRFRDGKEWLDSKPIGRELT